MHQGEEATDGRVLMPEQPMNTDKAQAKNPGPVPKF